GTDGSTPSLGGLPNWVPGAGDEAGAQADCGDTSFTGGPVELSQWTTSVDNDIVCGTPLDQISGNDAVATSIAISQQEFPSTGSAKAVVLARSDFFSDALAGGPLAAQVGGPLLITPGAAISPSIDPRVENEIERVLPAGGTVYVLGGDLALSPMIDTTLEGIGYQVVREAGADQYATAVDIAEQMGNPTTVFEATGLTFYDALSAVPAAIKEHAAILLTDGSTQAPETALYLARFPIDTRYAIGGTFAAAGADPTATPVYGQDLFATSAAVATRFFPGAAVFGAATAVDFPDALGGGVFMATGGRSGPLLLVDLTPPIAQSVAAYLATLKAKTPGYVFGGTLAVPPAVVAALSAAVG
ncbi:MAG TPA: cell wall-binding repeat-containing protein, partial [Acidimicrobiia bacterium]|nr:cell wall-binding repeat-containing protein [Acidimicrobiia bacterium]